MATNLAGIETGMDVLDTAGEKVGKVADVLAVTAQSATASSTAASYGDSYGSSTVGEGSYLKIEQGGVLGIGATDLYVPFSAVQNVVPGDNLTINCTKDQCGNLYGKKPEFLA